MRADYTHGGSVWKSLFLMLRGIVSLTAFAGVWIGMLWRETATWAYPVLWISAAVFVLCIIFHLFIPLLHLFR